MASGGDKFKLKVPMDLSVGSSTPAYVKGTWRPLIPSARRLDTNVLRQIVPSSVWGKEEQDRLAIKGAFDRMRDQIAREAPECSGCEYGQFQVDKRDRVERGGYDFAISAKCIHKICAKGPIYSPLADLSTFEAAKWDARGSAANATASGINASASAAAAQMTSAAATVAAATAGTFTREHLEKALKQLDVGYGMDRFQQEFMTHPTGEAEKPVEPAKHDVPATAADAW